MEQQWKVKKYVKRVPRLKKPVLIEGLPGIGNVGKIAADFLIDDLKAKPIYSFHSYSFPHSVFVNEENLVDIPAIMLYYAKHKAQDILILAGDIQPTDEISANTFTEIILEIAKDFKCKEIVTIGGIGLMDVPEKPKIFCTANDKKIITKYKKFGRIDNKIYGVVGPIIGVTGLMVGNATDYDMQAIALLAETFGHPMYLGIKGARKIVQLLAKRLEIKINIKQLDKEIKKIEKEMTKRNEELAEVQDTVSKIKKKEDVNYIG